MIGHSLKKGFARISQLPLLLSLFFLYQLLWGVILYLAIKSVLIPILFRLPDKQTAPELFNFFLIESQIRCMKMDVAVPALLLACTLIALRLVITPILNVGLYSAIQDRGAAEPQLTLFVNGMRKHSLAFLFIHLLQWTIMLLPIIMFVPLAGKEDMLQLVSAVTLSENQTMLFALLTGTCLYFSLIRLMT